MLTTLNSVRNNSHFERGPIHTGEANSAIGSFLVSNIGPIGDEWVTRVCRQRAVCHGVRKRAWRMEHPLSANPTSSFHGEVASKTDSLLLVWLGVIGIDREELCIA